MTTGEDPRAQLKSEIGSALNNFQLLRTGKLAEFRDSTGLHDDGEGELAIVTSELVDEYEENFRLRWSWLMPGLVENSPPVK
jgi:hypothetical protein